MPERGLMLPDETAGVDQDRTIQVATRAEDAGFATVWKEEASWGNGPMTLSAIARETDEIRLGTAIVNVYSRTPSLLAMTAATLNALSDGRAVLGLGVSTKPLIEGWHGMAFERPLRRTRETIDILRRAAEGGKLEYEGEIFDVGPYGVGFDAEHASVPIYNAAMGETNCRLTGEFADGWIPAFVPLSGFDDSFETIAAGARDAGRDPDEIRAVPTVAAAVHEEPAVAKGYVRDFLAREMAMGYNRLAEKHGFGEAGNAAYERWRNGDREGAAAAITDEMVEEFAIYGTPAECQERLDAYDDAGVDEVVLCPPRSAPPEITDNVVDHLGPR